MWAESASIHHSHWSMSRAPKPRGPSLERKHVTIRQNQRNAPREEAFVEVIPGPCRAYPGMMRAGNPTKMSGGSRNTRKKLHRGRNRIDTRKWDFLFSVGSISGQQYQWDQGSSLPTRRPNVQDDVPSGTKQKWLLPEPSSCGFNQTHVCEISTSWFLFLTNVNKIYKTYLMKLIWAISKTYWNID